MAEEKPGLLKRIFSFGFGRKKVEEDGAAAQAQAEAARVEAERLESERQAEAERQKEAERRAEAERQAALERERQAAEEEAARQAAAKDAAAKDAAAREAAQRKAAAKAVAEKEAAERLAAESAERARKAAAKAEEDARKAREKAEAEAKAARLKAEEEERRKAAGETARLKQEDEERLAAEKAERQRAEAERQRLAAETSARAAVEDAGEPEEAAAPSAAEEDDGIAEDAGQGDALEELHLEDSRVTLTERKVRKPKETEPEPEPAAGKEGWLKRLTRGLSRSSQALTENITQVFANRKLDDDTLQELEDVLIQADLGIETSMRITDALSDRKFGKSVTDSEVREVMAEEIEKILEPVARDLELDLNHQPHVILVVGVNGSGKTTTIGKLAAKLYDAGFSTTLVAGDTFRAAAIEQLKIWGERTMSPVVSRELGSDAAGLAFDAWQMARDDRRDVLLIDTAGRLQNKKELMAELEKIVRVLRKQDPSAPHTVLLTLDATTGQNAMNQVEIFKDIAGVNGIVMTKLDGTARGGILVAISAKHRLPVYFVGVGEQVADLEPFEARDFARSIAGLPPEE